MSKKIKRVLVIRFNSIGDLILCSPVIRQLNKSGYEVDFLVKENYKYIVKDNPCISKLITYQGNFWECLKILRSRRYDHIIDLHNNLRSRLFTAALLKPVSRFQKKPLEDFLLTRFSNFRTQRKHVVFRFLETLKPLISEIPESPKLEYHGLGDLPVGFELPDDYVAVSIASAFATKDIPEDHLLKVFNSLPHQFVLLGSMKDLPLADRLIAQASNANVFSAVSILNLHQTASVIEKASVLLTGDSGLMHMASALGTATVSVFGSTHPILGYTAFHKPEIQDSIIQNNVLNCRPCTKQGRNGCPKGHFKCMRDISVEELLAKVEQMAS